MTHVVDPVDIAVVAGPAELPADAEIRQELDVLLRSRGLCEFPRLQRMLLYVVSECLAGRANTIKAYSIAVDVFGRSSSFNPSTDAVVRVHASRLRAVLEDHYSREGRDSAVRIHLPKGSYVPKFERRQPTCQRAELTSPQDSAGTPTTGWFAGRSTGVPFGVLGLLSVVLLAFSLGLSFLAPTSHIQPPSPINSIALFPIWTSGTDARTVQTAAALSHEFLRVISASHHISLKLAEPLSGPTPSSDEMKDIARALHVRWLLWSTLASTDEGQHRVVVSISDGETGRVLRSNAYSSIGNKVSLVERAEEIVADLRPQFLELSKRAVEASASSVHSPLEQFLLLTWTSGTGINRLDWELERVAMARSVIAKHPLYGPAHAVLADKLAYLANVNPPSDTASNLAEARRHADIAIETSPDMAEAVFNVSAYAWHIGRLDDAIAFSRRTLDLSPRHVLARLHVTSVPYTCRPAPAPVIRDLEDLDERVSASNPIRWVILSWLTRLHLNNGHYDEAVRTGQLGDHIFRTPDTIMQFAAALVATGRRDDALHLLRTQKANWPHLDPHHYVTTTLPRRCREQGVPEALLRTYQGLIAAAAMQ